MGDIQMDPSNGVVIRSTANHAELQACIDLQIEVWGFHPRDAVPIHQLVAAHEWGGRVLVAVVGDRVVGFCYGFAGRQYGKPALLSHMLAVLPEYRGQGIGVELKLAQARWARDNGYDLITWTFDPLEAANANLNIGRLGGIVRKYLVNHYGEMSDGLNRGLPSDRLLLEWHLRRPNGPPPPPVPGTARTCTIPRNFQAIKATDPAAARCWRLQVREQIQEALTQGYIISGFSADAQNGTYLMTREGVDAVSDLKPWTS